MVLVPRYRKRTDPNNVDPVSGEPADVLDADGRKIYDIDIENASDGDLCIDWTTPDMSTDTNMGFDEVELIGRSNRMHHIEPRDEDSEQPIRTPWGPIDTRVRKTESNWPLQAEKLVTWRKTFGRGKQCRDGNDFTTDAGNCLANQYAAATICERRGVTLCTTEQYQALQDFQEIFLR